MNRPLLQTSLLERRYKTRHTQIDLFKQLSFEMSEKDTVSIMGASGSGKSTLLHIIGGLDSPDSGEILFRGDSIYKMGHRWRGMYRHQHVGFIFQSYHLLSELTIQENVALPAQIHNGRKSAMQKAAELLDAIGLSDRLTHRPQELSGGEQQRAAIARALVNNPSLILADEPTGNLDAVTGEKVLHYLFQLIESRGHSLVLVTHAQQVAKLCTKNYVLEAGILKEVDG
jgi:ABC-type lipoprotein export system ATPase subunit|tara:strand:- start:13322 stop:14005 length:684 start_codon:yes stop_codon:yes gene_type:complete